MVGGHAYVMSTYMYKTDERHGQIAPNFLSWALSHIGPSRHWSWYNGIRINFGQTVGLRKCKELTLWTRLYLQKEDIGKQGDSGKRS